MRCDHAAQIPGYFDFNTLTYGITHGLPLAEYLATIITTGEQPRGWDLSDFDPERYQRWATPAYVEAKVKETYALNNAIRFAVGSMLNARCDCVHFTSTLDAHIHVPPGVSRCAYQIRTPAHCTGWDVALRSHRKF